jgi:two-component system chemotaxis response regulator CheY
MLTKAGLNSHYKAFNGEEAVELYKKLNKRPDICLMDYRMPVKNGIEAAKEILEINKEAKIIFLTADKNVREEVLLLGIKKFLIKPFSLEILINTIEEVFNRDWKK